MSPEKSVTPFALFPLGENATDEARTWVQYKLHSPDMQESEIEKLKNSNPELFLYLQKMGFLRTVIQFDRDEKAQRAYFNGAFYVLEALRTQYDFLFKDVPTPSQDTMKTHFFNLLDIENNHGAIATFAPDIIIPDRSLVDIMEDFMGGYGTKTFDELTKLFVLKSRSGIGDLFYDNPLLEKNLVKTSLNQTHGPPIGLVYGAFDIFEIFRLHEEANEMVHLWDAPIR